MASRKKGPSQGILEGTLSPANEDVEAAAENYHDAMEKRIKMLAKEVELKAVLIDAMEKAKRHSYRRGRFEITLTTKKATKDVRVKILEEEPEPAKRKAS